jgi:hypothetical protein
VRVIVRWQEQTRPELEAWVQSLPGHDPERRALAQLVIEELQNRIRDAKGMPPGAMQVSGLHPPVYWWRAARGIWLRFAVRDAHKRFFGLLGREARKVTILELRRDRPAG